MASVVSAEPRTGGAGARSARPGPDRGLGRPRFSSRWTRALARAGALLLVLAVILAAAAAAVVGRLDVHLDRLPGVFAGMADATRPGTSEVSTSVIVVSDSGAAGAPPNAVDVDEPAEVVLLAQVSNGSAAIVALRPDAEPGAAGDAMTPGAAYALGGPNLLVRTVEELTDQRVDHFYTLDLAGLPEMVDAIGGVQLPLIGPDDDPAEPLQRQPVDGAQALAYARGEPAVAGGAAGRTYRWPTALRSLVQGMSQEMVLDPLGLVELLDVIGRTARADDTLGTAELWGLVVSLAGLRSERVLFLSVPEGELAELGSGPFPADHLDRHPEQRLRWRAGS